MKLSYSEPYSIDLVKEEESKSLGIGIVGGLDAPRGPIGFFIKNIYPNGLVSEDGRLKKGDEILSLNGISLNLLTHEQAVNKFRLISFGPVRLTVRSLVPSYRSLDISSHSASNQKSCDNNCYDQRGTASSPENLNHRSNLLYEILSECKLGVITDIKAIDIENEISDPMSLEECSLDDSTVRPIAKDTPFPVVNEIEPLLPEPVKAGFSSNNSSFKFGGDDSLMISTDIARDALEHQQNSWNFNYNVVTPLISAPTFCNSVGEIKKYCDTPDFEFCEELNNDYLFSPETDVLLNSFRTVDFFDGCLETMQHSSNYEIGEDHIEPLEEFTCSSSMYIAYDSESDDEHMDGDGDARGNKEIASGSELDLDPDATNQRTFDVCDYQTAVFIENEKDQDSQQTTLFQNKCSFQGNFKLDNNEQNEFEEDYRRIEEELNCSATTNFELPGVQDGDDANANVPQLVVNTIKSTVANVYFSDHADEERKRMSSKELVTTALLKSHFESIDRMLEPLPPPLPSSAPPPPLLNSHTSTSNDLPTNRKFEGICESITFDRDYMPQLSSLSSSFPFLVATKDETDVQLNSPDVELMAQGVSWPEAFSTNSPEQKLLLSSSCFVPETAKDQTSNQKYFFRNNFQSASWQSDLEAKSLDPHYLSISQVIASQANVSLVPESTPDNFEAFLSDHNVDPNMRSLEETSRCQNMITTEYDVNAEDSLFNSLILSTGVPETLSTVSHNDMLYPKIKQICQDKESQAIARDEKEPFQLKLNKNCSTVISSIDGSSSSGQNRVNDYLLLAVNGISLEDQTAADVQVSEQLASHPTDVTTKCSTGKTKLMELQKDKAQNLTQTTTDCKENSSLRNFFPATYVYSMSRQRLRKDETVDNVLKDYYVVEEVSEKKTTLNKPKKPVIAQALLPKSKQFGSLLPGSGTSSTSFNGIQYTSSLTENSASSAQLTGLPSFDHMQSNLANSNCLSSFIKKTEDRIKDLSCKKDFECKPVRKEPNKSIKSNSMNVTQPSFKQLNSSEMIYNESLRDLYRPSNSELQCNTVYDRISVNISDKTCVGFDDDNDSASTDSSSSNFSSEGISYQSSKNSSGNRTTEDVETNSNINVASSRAFFESINDASNKTLALKGNKSSGRTNQPNAHGKGEKISEMKFSYLDPETSNTTSAVIVELGNSCKPKTTSKAFPKYSLHSEMQIKTDEKLTVDCKKNSESKISTGIIKKPDNKSMKVNILPDSDRFNMNESKAFFKSMENPNKFDSVQDLTTTMEPKLGKNLSRGNESTEIIEADKCTKADVPFHHKLNENAFSNVCMNNQDFKYSGIPDVELVNVIEAKAYFESLKPSTFSPACKLNSAAQKNVAEKVDSKSEVSELYSNQSIQAQSRIQTVFQRNSTQNVSVPTIGTRHSSLPLQKYLPVSDKICSKPVASSMTPSQVSQRVPNKLSLQMTKSSETPVDRDQLQSSKELSLKECEALQNTVEMLVSKYTTLLPSPKTYFDDERKQDRESAGNFRFHQKDVVSESTLGKDTGIGNPSTTKASAQMERSVPPLPLPGEPSATISASGALVALPIIGSGAKSQKWKQFMTDYSSMK